jgi:hypothetical protein
MSGMLPNLEFSRAVTRERERAVRGHVEQLARSEAVGSAADVEEKPRRHRIRRLGQMVLRHGHHVSRPRTTAGTPATARPGR